MARVVIFGVLLVTTLIEVALHNDEKHDYDKIRDKHGKYQQDLLSIDRKPSDLEVNRRCLMALELDLTEEK